MFAMRGNGRLSVVEPLRLVSLYRFGTRVRFVVHDRRRRRYVIRFHCASLQAAREHQRVGREWLARGTALASVHGGGEDAVVDVDALLARLVTADEKHLGSP